MGMITTLFTLRALAAAPDAGEAGARALILDVPGADDDCCAQKVASVLAALPGIVTAGASFAEKRACARAKDGASLDPSALIRALEAEGYPVAATHAVAECPTSLRPRNEPWDAHRDVDARVVSRGEVVTLDDVRVADGYTIIDYGAPWCGPCFTVAGELAAYLRANADTHVRVVWLDAPDAVASFALPVAQAHLRYASALPWFVVLDPRGKRIHEGGDATEAARAIDKARRKRR